MAVPAPNCPEPHGPTMRVRCDGSWHRVRLVEDRMVLDDHPDIDAERALVALGGDRPGCLERLDQWEEAIADGGFLEEWAGAEVIPPGRIGWLVTALERTRNEGLQEYLRHVPARRAARMGRFVVDFHGPWLDRAAVRVAARVAGGEPVACAQAGRFVREAAALRLRGAFVEAVAHRTPLARGSAALVPLRITVGVGVAPRAAGSLDGRASWASLTVDHGWLAHVWGRGLAVVDGHLVVAVDGDHYVRVAWAPGATGRALAPRLERAPLTPGPR